MISNIETRGLGGLELGSYIRDEYFSLITSNKEEYTLLNKFNH